ncbi:MAG: hypothetical protein H6Q53_351, partial [Deltaproteobacteria bacterium]|nr:hypothetical protein [Deltaproteobacteria bacterium]
MSNDFTLRAGIPTGTSYLKDGG